MIAKTACATLSAVVLAVAAASCGGSDSSGAPASDGGAGEGGSVTGGSACGADDCTTRFDAGATEDAIQNAFATAKPGWTFTFAAGTFSFSNEITIGADHVSVVGAGIDQTVFDFSKQVSGSEGVFAQNVKDLRLEGFTVKDTKGNGVKVLGSDGVTFRKVKATWTGAEPSKHGGYGLYPVQSQNVLIDGCVASGASDSGLYIGQSKNVIVKGSEAFGNVAGIEIENTFLADVFGNDSHDNTGGILVFDLPELQQLGGHGVRVHDNKIHDNNTKNFAPAGNIVGNVPAGTGSFVMANHDVEFANNTFTNNGTAQLSVVSYIVVQIPIKDPNYYPFPAKISIHDNTFTGGGASPDVGSDLGLLLYSGTTAFTDHKIPDIVYDGIVDPNVTGPAGNPMQICIHQTGSHFSNLHFDQLDAAGSNLSQVLTMDPAGFDCVLPPVSPVTLPGADGGAR